MIDNLSFIYIYPYKITVELELLSIYRFFAESVRILVADGMNRGLLENDPYQ